MIFFQVALLTQHLRHEMVTIMKRVYDRFILEQCEFSRKYLMLTMAILQINPSATYLLSGTFATGVSIVPRGATMDIGLCVDVGESVVCILYVIFFLRRTQKIHHK